jgi:hypothetical protein
MAVVYHWKHGWIPLDHTAALSKAKGNHEAAAKMLGDARGGGTGIKSRRDVAGAMRDLPNLSRETDRRSARDQIHDAASKHNATDLLPKTKFYDPKTGPSDAEKLENAARMFGTNSPQYRAALKKYGAKSKR